jgi:hypothetical protein
VRHALAIDLLVTLCARLRLATEALNAAHADVRGDDEPLVQPADIDLADLSPAERDRLMALGQQDLWPLITSHQPSTDALPADATRRTA